MPNEKISISTIVKPSNAVFPRKSNIIKKHKKTKSFCIFASVISPNEARNLPIAAT